MDTFDECSPNNSAEDMIRSICNRVSDIDNKILPPPTPPVGNPKRVLELVLAIFGFAGVGFIIGGILNYIVEGQYYSISFEGGAVTFTDDETVAMNIKDDIISIYGVTPSALKSTDLTDGSQQTIDATRVSFHNTSSQSDQVDYSVEINASPFLRGQFKGWMEITNANNTIFSPLNVSSGAYILAPIYLVLTGVCTSVCLWEIIRYSKFKANRKGRDDSQMMQTVRRRRYFEASMDNYMVRDEREGTTVSNIVIIEFISALFGIAVGLVITYNDIISSSYLVLDFSKALVLFGIGLGAGSLKELVDK